MKSAGKSDLQNIIGQFGVGFYSVFMVADSVTVYSQSYLAGEKPFAWKSDGSGSYEIAECADRVRGTKIVIKLKKKCSQFAHPDSVREAIKKYSNFVQFPIFVNGDRCNTIDAIWTLSKDKVTDEMHKEFYQFLTHQKEAPLMQFMYATDSPIHIRSVFYVGKTHAEKFGMQKMDMGVNLYSRRVLIQPKAEGLLPGWLRFVSGVVDSEDVPLSVSREHLQDQKIIQRISAVLTKRILKEFKELLKSDEKKYERFYEEFSVFFKEAICTDMRYKDELAALLKYQSSLTPTGTVTLDAYVDRMKDNQKEIYYLHCPSRELGKGSPYFEAFEKKGLEVLFLYSMADEVVMQNIIEYRGKRITSIESAHIDLNPFEDDPKYAKPNSELEGTPSSLSDEETTEFCKWLKETALKDKVSEVKVSDRLVETPVLITDYEGAQMRRMMKFVDPQGAKTMTLPLQKLQINPKHKLIKSLASKRKENETLATLAAEQLFDNALVNAGLLDDSRTMLPRINKILEAMVSGKQ